jgi:hypothetical protein
MTRLILLPAPISVGSVALKAARLLTVLLIALGVLVASVGIVVSGFYRDSAISLPIEYGNDRATLVVGIPCT